MTSEAPAAHGAPPRTAGPDQPRHGTVACLSAAVFFIGGILLGALSDGVHHDDDLAHFLFARWSWWYPGYLVHVWGRPGFTVPMSLVAGWFDRDTAWHLARAASACITVASALIAADLARRIDLKYWYWIPLLCYVQPLNMRLSFTTLTENFAALYLTTACYGLFRNRPVWASAAFSLVTVTRIETVALLPVWCWIVAHRHRDVRTRIGAAAAAVWAPALQNVAHWLIFDTWPISAFFEPTGSTEYPTTGPLAFLPSLLLATTPLILSLAVIGVRRTVQCGGLAVALLAGAFVTLHGLIKWFGLFASGGYGRFVVTVAPLIAITAAAGIEICIAARRDDARRRHLTRCAVALVALGIIAIDIEQRAGRLHLELAGVSRVVAYASVAAMLVASCIRRCHISRAVTRTSLVFIAGISIVQWLALVRPLTLTPAQVLSRDVAMHIEQDANGGAIFAANPWIAWWCGHVENPRAHKGPRLLSAMPPGTWVVWDSVYSPSDYHGLSLGRLSKDPAYRMVDEFTANGSDVRYVVFEKRAATPAAPDGRPHPRPLTTDPNFPPGAHYVLEK